MRRFGSRQLLLPRLGLSIKRLAMVVPSLAIVFRRFTSAFREEKGMRSAWCCSIGVALFTASVSLGAVSVPPFSFSLAADGVAGGGNVADFGTVVQTAPTEWLFQGSYHGNSGTALSWIYLVDPDPFVTGTFTVTNETTTTRDYVLDFVLPISPALTASLLSGQVSGTLTDSEGSGSALLTSISGGFVYSALADDSIVQGLMANALQQVTSVNGTTSFSGGSFGFPVPVSGPSINSSIGIRFAFSLSAGDSASFSSVFVANPIPAPSVLVVGCLLGVGSRKRDTRVTDYADRFARRS